MVSAADSTKRKIDSVTIKMPAQLQLVTHSILRKHWINKNGSMGNDMVHLEVSPAVVMVVRQARMRRALLEVLVGAVAQ